MDCLPSDILVNITQYFNDDTAMRFFATSKSFLKWGKENFIMQGYYFSHQAIKKKWRYTKLKQYHHQIPIPQGVTELEDTRYININGYTKKINDEFVKGLPTSIHTLKLCWYLRRELKSPDHNFNDNFGCLVLPNHIKRICCDFTYINMYGYALNISDKRTDKQFNDALIIAPGLETFTSKILSLNVRLYSDIKNMTAYQIINDNNSIINTETLTCNGLSNGNTFLKLRKWILNLCSKSTLRYNIMTNRFPVLEKLYINNKKSYPLEFFEKRRFPNLKVLTICDSRFKLEDVKKTYHYLENVKVRILDHHKLFKVNEF